MHNEDLAVQVLPGHPAEDIGLLTVNDLHRGCDFDAEFGILFLRLVCVPLGILVGSEFHRQPTPPAGPRRSLRRQEDDGLGEGALHFKAGGVGQAESKILVGVLLLSQSCGWRSGGASRGWKQRWRLAGRCLDRWVAGPKNEGQEQPKGKPDPIAAFEHQGIPPCFLANPRRRSDSSLPHSPAVPLRLGAGMESMCDPLEPRVATILARTLDATNKTLTVPQEDIPSYGPVGLAACRRSW